MKRGGLYCGGRRGGLRDRAGHRFRRREERALPPVPAPRAARVVLGGRLGWALGVLDALPPPWEADVDDPVFDAAGHVVDGAWTGKFYTGRRGSFCTYLDGESYYRTTTVVLALAEVRNALPELVRLARLGEDVEVERRRVAAERRG